MKKDTVGVKFIIVNTLTSKALYGKKNKTILFSEMSSASEVATQLLDSYLIVEINLP